MPGFPELTPEGVQQLIARLDEELGRVQKSNASDSLKKVIGRLMGKLQAKVEPAIRDIRQVKRWRTDVQEGFDVLTQLLAVSLQLASSDMGACRYSVDGEEICLTMTELECQDLGGAFTAGKDCEGFDLVPVQIT